MKRLRLFIFLGMLMIVLPEITAQSDQLAYLYTGVIYDEFFRPVPYTHVLASGTGEGDVSDSLGIFSLYIRKSDQLSFYNIGFQDTSKFVSVDEKGFYIILRKRVYSLREARVFTWGSTYGDFLEEVKRQGDVPGEGEKLGLPRQDPDVIPFYMDDAKIKSFNFFIQSPLSSLYYNLSKKEKGARKAYQLEKDKLLIERFKATLSEENISDITGLAGKDLEQFILFLNENLLCTYHCPELSLLTEIYSLWNVYQGRE